jgi:small ligand-binding sensory domain FIST
MKITAAASLIPETSSALSEIAERVRHELGGIAPDLAFMFVSPHHAGGIGDLLQGIFDRVGPRHLVGCVGESVIEGPREFEQDPSVVLWAACLPEGSVRSGRVTLEMTPDGPLLSGVPDLGGEQGSFFLIGDPYSFDAEVLIERLADESPGTQVLGGMASGARAPGETRLVHDREVLTSGAVYAFVPETVRVRPLVSQGCRPFGKKLVITRAEQNLLLEIGGRPAFEKLSEQLVDLPARDRALLQHGLHIGLAIDARQEEHRRGDFLIRNVMGVVPEHQALVVTDHLRPGMTVQFHLRDAASASEDLVAMLRDQRADMATTAGGLLFTCNGRGSRLFQQSDHDARTVQREIGELPLAGFFAAGEIGPVGGHSFLHGFTASLALFEAT